MTKGLIGFTGFVGSNLLAQQPFDDCYNSSNISQIQNKNYEHVFCAGVSATKWIANRDPDNDRKKIQSLIEHLKTIKVKKFILISTVDIYPSPINVDENSAITLDDCQPYGKHRLELERFISNEFDSLIVRLPGLFGTGLRKNIIFDFLNNNNMEQINPNSVFQFYSLDHLSRDIEKALKNNLNVLNMSSEPISVQEVAKICLGHDLINEAYTHGAGAEYDYKSCHAQLYDGKNGYLYSKEEVLLDLKEYVSKSKNVI